MPPPLLLMLVLLLLLMLPLLMVLLLLPPPPLLLLLWFVCWGLVDLGVVVGMVRGVCACGTVRASAASGEGIRRGGRAPFALLHERAGDRRRARQLAPLHAPPVPRRSCARASARSIPASPAIRKDGRSPSASRARGGTVAARSVRGSELIECLLAVCVEVQSTLWGTCGAEDGVAPLCVALLDALASASAPASAPCSSPSTKRARPSLLPSSLTVQHLLNHQRPPKSTAALELKTRGTPP
jgi:hypothetical protein